MLGKIDELNESSREFYERAKLKLSLSLFSAALGMMFLGLCAQSGGTSNGLSELKSQSGLQGYQSSAYQDKISGYGFGSFVYIVAFLICTGAAIYLSPLVASSNEKVIISNPQNVNFREISVSADAYTASSRPVSVQQVDVMVGQPNDIRKA